MPPSDDGVSLGELSRRLGEVFQRLEGVVQKLEQGYVRSDVFDLSMQSLGSTMQTIRNLIEKVEKEKAELTDYKSLEKRVADLEDDKKWAIRLVLGFIILGILGAVYTVSGGNL